MYAADSSEMKYCPFCGNGIYISHADGTVECDVCGRRFGVVKVEPDTEGDNE